MDVRYSKSVRKMTSTEKNDLNIRSNASPKIGQDQVSGGVSVICWLAAPVAKCSIGTSRNLVIRSKSAKRTS